MALGEYEVEKALRFLSNARLMKYDSSFSFLRNGVANTLKDVLMLDELDKIYLLSGETIESFIKSYNG